LLAKARGFERPLFFVAGLAAMLVAFGAFSFATKTMSSAVANAVWSGLSLALVAAAGKFFLSEHITLAQSAFLALIVVGVAGLQLFAKS